MTWVAMRSNALRCATSLLLCPKDLFGTATVRALAVQIGMTIADRSAGDPLALWRPHWSGVLEARRSPGFTSEMKDFFRLLKDRQRIRFY